MKRAIKIVVAACISIGLIVWAFWKADVSVIADVFASADWRWVAVAVCVVLATPLVHCWRWRMLIRMTGDDAPYVPLVPVYFAGMLANLALPAELGLDAVRVQFGRRFVKDRSTMLTIVAADRIVGAWSLALVAGVCSLALVGGDAPTWALPIAPCILVFATMLWLALVFPNTQFVQRLLKRFYVPDAIRRRFDTVMETGQAFAGQKKNWR